MSRFYIFGAVAVLVFSMGFEASAALDQKASAFVLCKDQHNRTVRSIRVMPSAGDTYTVTYNKGGVDEVVGANRSLSASQEILHKIEGKLKSSEWNCRNISSAVVTTSAEVVHQ